MAPVRTFGPDAPGEPERRKLLELHGPILEIVIHREPGAKEEESVPQLHATPALIDTGASDVCIHYAIAHALRLRKIRDTTIVGVGGSVPGEVYLGEVEVPALGFRRLMPLVSSKLIRSGYRALLGRSFLSNYIVTFNGPTGVFHFTSPTYDYPEPPDDA